MGKINPLNVAQIVLVEIKQWLTESGAFLRDDFDKKLEKDNGFARFVVDFLKDEYLGNDIT